MISDVTSRDFAAHYVGYYSGDPALSAWREAGAKEKYANIAALWQSAGAPTSPTVIDIGCGDGAIAAEMAGSGFYENLTGLDVSDSGIALANSRNLPSARFSVFQGETGARDKEYDLAVLSHVVEHVEEPRKVIREAARVARWVILEVPLEHTIRHRGDFRWTDTGHVNFFDADLIRKLVQSCGLTVEKTLITAPGLHSAAVSARRGARLAWMARRLALTAAPPIAQQLFVYHATLLVKDVAKHG
jgi:SAM-dependent methyltransferase